MQEYYDRLLLDLASAAICDICGQKLTPARFVTVCKHDF